MAIDEKDLIKKFGRISCVDPNDVFGYGIKKYKTETTEDGEEKQTLIEKDAPFTPPYEDLCIAFNLIIEKYDRFDAKKRTEIGMEWTDKPNGQTSHFSVLGGELKTENDKMYVPKYDDSGNLINPFRVLARLGQASATKHNVKKSANFIRDYKYFSENIYWSGVVITQSGSTVKINGLMAA